MSESFSTAFLIIGLELFDRPEAPSRWAKAAWPAAAGALLGCAVVARYGAAAAVMPAMLWLLICRRFRDFALASGGRILSVLRASGAIDRYALSEDHATALRFAINEALSHSGRVVTEERADVRKRNRGRFVNYHELGLAYDNYGFVLEKILIEIN